MTATDLVAIYAAIVATGVLVWDVFKWRRAERTRLAGSVMRNAIIVGGYGKVDRDTKYIVLTVNNRGALACTITHYYFESYENWFSEMRGKSNFNAIVNTSGGHGNEIPFELRPGGPSFTGMALQNAQMEELSRKGRLYAGIYHTRSDKPFRVRIEPITRDGDSS